VRRSVTVVQADPFRRTRNVEKRLKRSDEARGREYFFFTKKRSRFRPGLRTVDKNGDRVFNGFRVITVVAHAVSDFGQSVL